MKPTLTFSLRKDKEKDGLCPVLFRITIDGNSQYKATGIKVPKIQWDESAQRVKGNSKDAKNANTTLDTFYESFLTAKQDLVTEHKEHIHANYIEKMFPKNEGDYTLLKMIDDFIEMMEYKKREDLSTYRKYKTIKIHIIEFLGESKNYHGSDIHMSKADYEFIIAFYQYLKGKGIGQNSAKKYMDHLKSVFVEALNRERIYKNPFNSFKVKKVKVDKRALNFEEFQKLSSADMKSEHLTHVRNIFILQCLTGLAYADLKAATMKDITPSTEGLRILNITRAKSTEYKDYKCRIPVLALTEKIINQYKNDPARKESNLIIPISSNQKYNDSLKKMAIVAQLENPLEITTHVGRRTFATVAMELGMDAPTIISVLGHQSFEMLKRYAKTQDTKIVGDFKKFESKLKIAL